VTDGKGPSTFDVTHVLSASLVQDLPIDRWFALNRFVPALTSGWQALGLVTLTSGLPLTIYSGIQQPGAGSIGADRPDQIGQPDLSTGRAVREGYFGLESKNASLFSIPINGLVEPGRTRASSERSDATPSADLCFTISTFLCCRRPRWA
jgi:hypothetical protein